MWSELYSWIGKHYPLGIFVICIIAITAYVVTHFLRWTHRVEKVEDECKKIEGHLKPQLVSINSSLTTLNGSFNSLIVYLKSKDEIRVLNVPAFLDAKNLQPFVGEDLIGVLKQIDYIDKKGKEDSGYDAL